MSTPSGSGGPRAYLAVRDDRAGQLPALLEACGVAVVTADPARADVEEARICNLVVQEFRSSDASSVKAVERIRAGGARLIGLVDETDPGFVCDLYRAGASVVFNRSVGAYHVFLQCCAFLQIWRTDDAPVRIGSAIFEPGARRLILDDRSEAHLTEAESKILAMLAASPERYVGRSEISEHVFRIPYDKFDRRIDVHVSNLRKKFRQHGLDTVIDTSRLNGFRLIAGGESQPDVKAGQAVR